MLDQRAPEGPAAPAPTGASAHVDRFCRENLPPPQLWPRMDYGSLPELAYPGQLNAAVELLDRTVAALARFGTPGAVKAAVTHGLKRQPLLGDTMARLTDLGSQDLSSEPATVDILLKNLRSELPMKVLGFVIQRKSENVFYLLEALSGTQTPEVREALEQIVSRFPDHDFGRAAEKTLSSLGAVPRPSPATAASHARD